MAHVIVAVKGEEMRVWGLFEDEGAATVAASLAAAEDGSERVYNVCPVETPPEEVCDVHTE